MRPTIFTILLLAGGAAHAGAVTIDFDATLPTYFGLASYQEDGVTLTSNVPDGTLIDVNNLVRGNLGVFSGGTGSQSLFWGANNENSVVGLSDDAGRQFDLLSFDASAVSNASGQLLLTGTLFAGGTVSQTINLTGALSTYAISGMTGLSSLDISFDGSAYYAPFDLDNVQLNIVPIPAAVWLFGSALVALGYRRVRTVN